MTQRNLSTINRRRFLQSSAAASMVGIGFHSSLLAQESKSPNEKLDIACIGVANRARANVSGVQGENIVALCDIDENYLKKAGAGFAKAKLYSDVRKVYDQEKSLDAVVVSTPDHMHFHSSYWAMQLGKHVYCEKPLTHSVWEARTLATLAKEKKLATQMGTQIHAGNNYRRVVEIIQSGVIGEVTEVHVWVGKGWGGGERPTQKQAIPSHIHWDLWLGPAPERPYHSTYLPANWRRWWDFGGGTLGDMACHYKDLPFWALKLRHPTSIKAEGAEVHPETCPLGLKVEYEYPQRENLPAVKLTWYDGRSCPKEVAGHKVPGSGVMFLGSKGQMFANYGGYKLYPEDQFNDFTPPPQTIPNSIGHYNEWIKACKEGTPTTCNFDYSGALTESVLLGNVAYRTGEEILWDAETLTVANNKEANQLIRRKYRKGWEV